MHYWTYFSFPSSWVTPFPLRASPFAFVLATGKRSELFWCTWTLQYVCVLSRITRICVVRINRPIRILIFSSVLFRRKLLFSLHNYSALSHLLFSSRVTWKAKKKYLGRWLRTKFEFPIPEKQAVYILCRHFWVYLYEVNIPLLSDISLLFRCKSEMNPTEWISD